MPICGDMFGWSPEGSSHVPPLLSVLCRLPLPLLLVGAQHPLVVDDPVQAAALKDITLRFDGMAVRPVDLQPMSDALQQLLRDASEASLASSVILDVPPATATPTVGQASPSCSVAALLLASPKGSGPIGDAAPSASAVSGLQSAAMARGRWWKGKMVLYVQSLPIPTSKRGRDVSRKAFREPETYDNAVFFHCSHSCLLYLQLVQAHVATMRCPRLHHLPPSSVRRQRPRPPSPACPGIRVLPSMRAPKRWSVSAVPAVEVFPATLVLWLNQASAADSDSSIERVAATRSTVCFAQMTSSQRDEFVQTLDRLVAVTPDEWAALLGGCVNPPFSWPPSAQVNAERMTSVLATMYSVWRLRKGKE